MIIDIVILLVLLISATVAFFRGFIKEVLTIFGLGGAAVGAFLFGGLATPPFEKWLVNEDDPDYRFFGFFPDDILAAIVAYAVVFIAIFLVLALLSHFLSKGAEALGLGPVDRALGVVFGLVRGMLIVGIVYLSFSIIVEDGDYPEMVQDSKFVHVVDTSVDWALSVIGQEKPFDDKNFNEDGVKKNLDAIDRVKEGYIDADKKAVKDSKTKGYLREERKELQSLIEGSDSPKDDAVITGGNQ